MEGRVAWKLCDQFSLVEHAASAAADAQRRVGDHARQALFEIHRPEGKISVELDDVLVVDPGELSVARVKRVDHAGSGLPRTTVTAMDRSNPRVVRRRLVDQPGGVVGGAVVDEHPHRRPVALHTHRLDRQGQELLLVAHR